MKTVLNLKEIFGRVYEIRIDEAFYLDRQVERDPVEWYYSMPARYGEFFPYGGDTIAFCCTANRVKEHILRKFNGKVTLRVEGEDEAILLFNKELFLKIAPIARAKKKRGRKTLSEIEKKKLVEAGKGYQFTGKSLQHTELEQEISPLHDRSVMQ